MSKALTAPPAQVSCKCIVSGGALLRLVSLAAAVAPNKPVVPILSCLLVQCVNEQLTVTGSDLEMTLIAGPLPCESRRAEWTLAIPAKTLLDTLKNLPDQPLTLTADPEAHTLEIASANGRYHLAGDNPADFPLPAPVPGDALIIPSTTLARFINKTQFAISTDELRPQMTGVHFVLDGAGSATLTATNGNQLVRLTHHNLLHATADTAIIPGRVLRRLKSALPTETEPVKLTLGKALAAFEFAGLRLVCRLIDERYPDTDGVIPKKNPNTLLVDRLELLSSLKRVVIYANRTTHTVVLRLTGSELHVMAEDLDAGNSANERLACQYDGEDLTIGFNAKLLAECLEVQDTPEVQLCLSTPNRAALVLPDEQEAGEDLLTLLMPVILS